MLVPQRLRESCGIHDSQTYLWKKPFWKKNTEFENHGWVDGHHMDGKHEPLTFLSGYEAWQGHLENNILYACVFTTQWCHDSVKLTTDYKVRPVHSMFTNGFFVTKWFHWHLAWNFLMLWLRRWFVSQLGTAKFIRLIFENLTCIAGNCHDVLWVRQLTLIGTTHGIWYFMHGTDGLINNWWYSMVPKCGQRNIYPNTKNLQMDEWQILAQDTALWIHLTEDFVHFCRHWKWSTLWVWGGSWCLYSVVHMR